MSPCNNATTHSRQRAEDLRGTKYVPKLSRLLLIVGTANSNVSDKCTDCNPIDASLASKQGTNIPVK